MDLQRIETLPEFKPQLTAQEREGLLSLPEGQRKLAVAEDWSVILQRSQWTMERLQALNNFVVGFADVLAFWRIVRMVVIWLIGSAAGLLAIYKLVKSL